MDSLFGYLGIDTKYERELVYYRPILEVVKKPALTPLDLDTSILIQRAREFSISKVIDRYDTLLKDLKEIIDYMKEQEKQIEQEQLDKLFLQRKYGDILSIEIDKECIDEFSLFDKYSIALFIRDNIQTKRDSVLKYFSNRIYENEEDPVKIEEKELLSISEWEILKSKANEIYEEGLEEFDIDVDPYESIDLAGEIDDLAKEKEIFHQNLADISYAHLTFIHEISSAIEMLKILVLKPNSIVSKNDPKLQNSIYNLHNKESVLIGLELDFYEKVNKYFPSKQKLEILAYAPSEMYAEKADFHHGMNEEILLPLEETITKAKLGQSDYMRNVDELIEILSKQYVKLKVGYESTVSDMYKEFRREAGIFNETILFCRDKEFSKGIHSIILEYEEEE